MRVTASARNPAIFIVSNGVKSLYNFRGDLMRKLIGDGWRVYALAPDYDAATRARIEELGAVPVSVSMARNGMNPLRDLHTIIAIYREMRRVRPQIFFGYFMKPVIYGTIAAWLARVPRRVVLVAGLGTVYMDTDEAAPRKARLLRHLVSGLYAIAFRRADRVIFQNRDDLATMVDAGICPRDRATVVDGSGVNLEHFTQPADRQLGERPLTFIWTGRLLREKGVLELIEATQAVRARGGEVEVILVGGLDSNPGSLTQEEVQSWHDAGIVNWVGMVEDVRPYLWRSDVFVLPSYYREGIPRSTQEAMATGLAVITTDAPGCRETVVDDVNGQLVPVRSSGALADAMMRYVLDRALVARHAKASCALVEQKFDVHIINERMSAEVLGPDHKPNA
jgi:glycosyltransferase involved in cell wall biosynthesis